MPELQMLGTSVHQVAIAGSVLDAATKSPLDHARVEIVHAPARFASWLRGKRLQFAVRWDTPSTRPDRIMTTADGHFHFMDLPEGEYTLQASLPEKLTRYGVTSAQVHVELDPQGNIQMQTVTLELSPTSLHGQIMDARSGKPVPMAEVRVAGGGEHTLSTLDGAYSLRCLEKGERRVHVNARGYEKEENTVLLEQGAISKLDFRLKRSKNTIR